MGIAPQWKQNSLFPLESVISHLFYRPFQESVLELSESESKQY